MALNTSAFKTSTKGQSAGGSLNLSAFGGSAPISKKNLQVDTTKKPITDYSKEVISTPVPQVDLNISTKVPSIADKPKVSINREYKSPSSISYDKNNVLDKGLSSITDKIGGPITKEVMSSPLIQQSQKTGEELQSFIRKPIEAVTKIPALDTVKNTFENVKNIQDKYYQGIGYISSIPEVGKAVKNTTERTSGTGIIATIKSASPDVTFKEAYDAMKESQSKDPSKLKQFLYQLGDSTPQVLLGVALNFIPYAGRPLSTLYWTALSSNEQIEKNGKITSPGNVAIDVLGDRMLGSTLESLFKKPAKTLFQTIKKSFTTEGGTEVAQDLLKYGNDYRNAKTKEDKKKVIADTKEYFTSGQILMTLGVGGVSGAGIGAGSYMINSAVNSKYNKADLKNEKIKNEFFPKGQEKTTPQQTIERHLLEAQDVINDSPEFVKQNMSQFLDQIKTNMVDALKFEGHIEASNKINNIDITNLSSFTDLENAISTKTNIQIQVPSLRDKMTKPTSKESLQVEPTKQAEEVPFKAEIAPTAIEKPETTNISTQGVTERQVAEQVINTLPTEVQSKAMDKWESDYASTVQNHINNINKAYKELETTSGSIKKDVQNFLKEEIEDLNKIKQVALKELSTGLSTESKEITYPNKTPQKGVTIYAYAKGEEAKIDSIEISKEKQGSGIGTQEVEKFEKWALENGAKKVVIDAYKGSIGFWEKMGYTLDKEFPIINGVKQDFKNGYKDLTKVTQKNKKEDTKTPFANPEATSDTATIQEKRNAIAEGKMLLKNKDLSDEEKRGIAKSIASAQSKIGVEKKDGYTIEEISSDQIFADKPALKEEKTTDLPEALKGIEDDISLKSAIQAYYWNSHFPEKAGESVVQGYIETMKSDYEDLKTLADTPEKQVMLDTEFKRYREGYKKRTQEYISATGRTANAMVTGPARFPVAKNRIKVEYAQRKSQEKEDFRKKVMSKIKNELNPTTFKGTSEKTIDDMGIKLDEMKKSRDRMKVANKIIRSGKDVDTKLKEIGYSEAVIKELLSPGFPNYGKGFPSFSLTNLNNRIKGLEERLSTTADKREKANTTGSDVEEVNGVKLIKNYDENRIQIDFPTKPSQETINLLKSRAFKWSPRNKVWQRILTPQAEKVAKEIISTGIENKPVEQVTPTRSVNELIENYAKAEKQVKKLNDLQSVVDNQEKPEQFKMFEGMIEQEEAGNRSVVKQLAEQLKISEYDVIEALTSYIDSGERRGGRTIDDFYRAVNDIKGNIKYKRATRYYPFGRGPMIEIEKVADLIKDFVPKGKVELIFNPNLIKEKKALGLFNSREVERMINPYLLPVLELYTKNGKAYVSTAFHESWHYLEEEVIDQKWVNKWHKMTEERMSEYDRESYARKTYEEFEYNSEYIADEFAQEQTSKSGYRSPIHDVLNSIREVLGKIVNFIKLSAKRIDSFVKARGGWKKGAVNFFDDLSEEEINYRKEAEEDIKSYDSNSTVGEYIDRIVNGKMKIRIPNTMKTEAMYALGGNYARIFSKYKNSITLDEIVDKIKLNGEDMTVDDLLTKINEGFNKKKTLAMYQHDAKVRAKKNSVEFQNKIREEKERMKVLYAKEYNQIRNSMKIKGTETFEQEMELTNRVGRKVLAQQAREGKFKLSKSRREQALAEAVLEHQRFSTDNEPDYVPFELENENFKQVVEKIPTPVKAKVNFWNIFSTPEFILERMGLLPLMKKLRKGYENYLVELPNHMDLIKEWRRSVEDIPGSNERIFRYLDSGIDDAMNALSKKEFEVAIEIKQYLKDWALRLGLEDDQKLTHYITRLFSSELIQKEFDEDLAKIIRDKVPGEVYDPFLEKRLGTKGYLEDTWKALDAYAKRASRKVNMDPALKLIEEASVNLEKTQLEYIKKYIHGVNLRPTEVDEGLDIWWKQWFGYKLGQRPTALISRKARRIIYRGTIGGNFGSSMKNLTQVVNTYAVLGEKYTSLGYARLMTSWNSKELIDSGILDQDIVQDQIVSSYESAMKKLDAGLFYTFKTAEKINRGSAYFGAKAMALDGKVSIKKMERITGNKITEQLEYIEGSNAEKFTFTYRDSKTGELKLHVSELDAIEYAKSVVRQTQFQFGQLDTPILLQGDFAKTMLQFFSFPIKQTEFLINLAKDREWKSLMRYIFGTLFMTLAFGKMFNYGYDNFIPFLRFISVKAGIIPIPPVLKLPAEVISALMNEKGYFGQQRDTGEKINDVLSSVITYLPGGVQLQKTYRGYKRIYNPAKNQAEVVMTPGNIAKGLIFGPSNLKTRSKSSVARLSGLPKVPKVPRVPKIKFKRSINN